jgi:flagellar basal-body rod protein FlgG
MDASMWVAKTGLDAQQMRMNVISNNLANVNTSGFKRDRAVFEDLLYQNLRQAGGQTGATTQAPTGLMLGTGVRVVATEKLHAQGNMVNTQNPLDLAIAGEGFFQVTQADGTIAYSRDGNFKLSSTGQIVTSSGALLQPAITIPNTASTVTFGRDGTVSVELAAGGSQVLGQIQLAKFVNPSGLQSVGQNLMKETPASGAPQVLQAGNAGAGSLMQGTLEASNVNVVEEMVNMIETQRAYEINSKAISAVDGMLFCLFCHAATGHDTHTAVRTRLSTDC